MYWVKLSFPDIWPLWELRSSRKALSPQNPELVSALLLSLPWGGPACYSGSSLLIPWKVSGQTRNTNEEVNKLLSDQWLLTHFPVLRAPWDPHWEAHLHLHRCSTLSGLQLRSQSFLWVIVSFFSGCSLTKEMRDE